MPILVADRLIVRPIESGDLDAINGLYVDIGWTDRNLTPDQVRSRRQTWVDWTIAGYREFGRLYQPPLGERAVLSKSGEFLGLVGLVPAYGPFAKLPALGGQATARRTMEMGLFWAFAPAIQGRGFATEAAGALIAWTFEALALDRLVATTEHDNLASIAVMRRLGMSVERNPDPDPEWFQTVGVLNAPRP